jgi:hypothetical protein
MKVNIARFQKFGLRRKSAEKARRSPSSFASGQISSSSSSHEKGANGCGMYIDAGLRDSEVTPQI